MSSLRLAVPTQLCPPLPAYFTPYPSWLLRTSVEKEDLALAAFFHASRSSPNGCSSSPFHITVGLCTNGDVLREQIVTLGGERGAIGSRWTLGEPRWGPCHKCPQEDTGKWIQIRKIHTVDESRGETMSKETGSQVSKRCHIPHNAYMTQCFHKSKLSLSQKVIISLLILALGPMLQITVFLFAVVAFKYSSVLFLFLKYYFIFWVYNYITSYHPFPPSNPSYICPPPCFFSLKFMAFFPSISYIKLSTGMPPTCRKVFWVSIAFLQSYPRHHA